MWEGKKKAITFSYDDGVTQDRRLIKLFEKYGLKGTFNLNSALLGREGHLIREGVTVSHIKNPRHEVRHIYAGHEVAAHTLTHPFLPSLSDEEIVRQVEEDRQCLSSLVGYEVVGLAYPCGGENYDRRVANIVKDQTGIRYARTIVSSHSFACQEDLFTFKPTVYHHEEWDQMLSLAEAFLSADTKTPALFYIWGHAYEFDIRDTWDRFEDFCRLLSNQKDVFYGTNRDIFGV